MFASAVFDGAELIQNRIFEVGFRRLLLPIAVGVAAPRGGETAVTCSEREFIDYTASMITD
jgi:hypothetical protein